MADNVYLAECPFCAGYAEEDDYDPFDGYQGNNTVYRVKCRKCGAEVCGSTYAEAVRKWNRRAAKLCMSSLYGSSADKFSKSDLAKAFTSESPIPDLVERVIKKSIGDYFRHHTEERSED